MAGWIWRPTLTPTSTLAPEHDDVACLFHGAFLLGFGMWSGLGMWETVWSKDGDQEACLNYPLLFLVAYVVLKEYSTETL